jgi:hypothetical protein
MGIRRLTIANSSLSNRNNPRLIAIQKRFVGKSKTRDAHSGGLTCTAITQELPSKHFLRRILAKQIGILPT